MWKNTRIPTSQEHDQDCGLPTINSKKTRKRGKAQRELRDGHPPVLQTPNFCGNKRVFGYHGIGNGGRLDSCLK